MRRLTELEIEIELAAAECQHERITLVEDFGTCSETGNHDCIYECNDCGEEIR